LFVLEKGEKWGIHSYELMIEAASKKGLEHICFVKKESESVESILKVSQEKGLKVSFAFEISYFQEGTNKKENAYLVTRSKRDISVALKIVNKLKEDWISCLTKNELRTIENSTLIHFVPYRNTFIDRQTLKKHRIKIDPINFLTEDEKRKYHLLFPTYKGLSFESVAVDNETEEFLQNICF
jgi:hypothetical protein